jgi:hypothetical protein
MALAATLAIKAAQATDKPYFNIFDDINEVL